MNGIIPQLESLADREIRLSCNKCKQWHINTKHKPWSPCRCDCDYCSTTRKRVLGVKMNTINISKELQEQDNLATADPYWVIRDWEKVPTHPDYSDKSFWIMDDTEYSEEELKKAFKEDGIDFTDDNFEEVAEEHEWSKVYYLEKPVDTGVWLTHQAAKDHLAAKRHHYSSKAHTYAHSLYSCHEVREIRQLLLKGKVRLIDKECTE